MLLLSVMNYISNKKNQCYAKQEHTNVKMLVIQSCLTLCHPMDYIAQQDPLSMEFSRKEHWGGLPRPSPGDLPDPRIKPRSAALHANFLQYEPQRKPYTNVRSNVKMPPLSI